MNERKLGQGGSCGRFPAIVIRLIRRVGALIGDCNQAQRRAMLLRLDPDMYVYVPDPDRAPDTYAEFLFRSSGPLSHDPRADVPPRPTSSSTGSLQNHTNPDPAPRRPA